MNKYFVSYFFGVAGGFGMGSCEISLDTPISSMNHIWDIQTKLKENCPAIQDPIVINWKRFDFESGTAASEIERLQESAKKREHWKQDAKELCGFSHNESFDVVWKTVLDIIGHAYIHSNYRDCGFMQMTTQQKKCFVAILRNRELESVADTLEMLIDKS